MFKLTPKLTVCASGQIAAIQEHGTITKLDAKQRKLMVSAVAVIHSSRMESSTVAASIGMNRKTNNLLSQNSKLKFKLTPKLTVCASGQIAAIQEHGTITSLDAKQRKLMVSAVAVIQSRRMESSTVAASIGMNRKTNNLLSQNSKLMFKLTPKLPLCAKVNSAA